MISLTGCAATLLFASQSGAQTATPADLLGGGNFTNGSVGTNLNYQIQVLKTLGAERCRINLYPDAYVAKRNWDQPQSKPIDAVMTQLHDAGIRPMLLLEYYAHYLRDQGFGTYEQWKSIGRTLAQRYRPGGDWANENNITDGFGIELYTAFNEPEPTDFRLGGKVGVKPYVDALRGLADGVHSVDPKLKVAPGGFMAANAWKDWSLRGIGPALAPMLNDGTLAGLDLHTYYDVQWAPMEGGYASSAQNNFDQVKLACGITRDIEFFSTEFNYKNRACPPEQSAAGLFTGIWDNLAIVGNDGRTLKTELALPWNLFNLVAKDGQFGMSQTNAPYTPTLSGKVIQQVLELTQGMHIVAADPRRTGMIVLRGTGRTMWVWQNRKGWTDQPGTSVTLRGVPAAATEIDVHGWDGLRRKVPVTPGGSVTVAGLDAEQTVVFIAPAEEQSDPESLLPERAAQRPTLDSLRAALEKDEVASPYAVLWQEKFDFEGQLRNWAPADDGAKDPTLAATVVDATPLDGTCVQLGFTFSGALKGSRWIAGGKGLGTIAPAGEGAVYLRFMLRGSKNGRPVRVRMLDRDNETIVTGPVLASPVWRRVTFRLEKEWKGTWGEGKNGQLDWPLRLLCFEAMPWGGHSPADGEMIWIRDAQIVQELK